MNYMLNEFLPLPPPPPRGFGTTKYCFTLTAAQNGAVWADRGGCCGSRTLSSCGWIYCKTDVILALAFPKIIPGWWSFVVQMKIIYHSLAAGLVPEKTNLAAINLTRFSIKLQLSPRSLQQSFNKYVLKSYNEGGFSVD